MLEFISWYLLIVFIGLIFFPVIYKLMPFLSDRGYSFSRIAGLLVWGYLFWMLNIFGIIHNDLNGILLCFLLILIIAYLFVHKHDWRAIAGWIKENKKIIFITEILFFLSFLIWTTVRAANPDISGTEKPMELAFINSIMRSPSFPPADPWLSGYSISYYYFGYVMVAMLAKVINTSSSIAFNLSIATWFALTAIGCYGVVLNLLTIWETHHKVETRSEGHSRPNIIFASLLGPFFVLIVSNAEGFLEMLHSKGLFWKLDSNGVLTSKFWAWLNIQELNIPPTSPFSWVPERLGGIWWWRASRVLQDFDIAGNAKEIIDEFPFFTYLLGDLHPHLLAMPFVLLALGIGLNLHMGLKNKDYLETSIRVWFRNPFYWFVVLVCGGIAFLNTWDLPAFLGFILMIFVIGRIVKNGLGKQRIYEFLMAGLLLGISSIITYLPFFLGFSSQASGILPSINFFTRGINFWIMFLIFIVLNLLFLVWLSTKHKQKKPIISGMKYSFLFIILLCIGSYAIVILIGNANNMLFWFQDKFNVLNFIDATSISTITSMFQALHGSANINNSIIYSLQNRFNSPFTIITLIIMFALAVAGVVPALTKKPKNKRVSESERIQNYRNFPILLLIFLGTVLCIIPEFFYLKDVFGTRMNTIFKFYFQTWVLWGLASATGFIILWFEIKKIWGHLFKFFSILLIIISLAYPFWSLLSKTNGFKPLEWTLDGNAFLHRYNEDEYNAIVWLNTADYGILAEAIGGSYSNFARISSHTGLPTVLGWPGHELQWRGGTNEMGTREGDIQLLYSTPDWLTAKDVIDKYGIRYIYISDLERSKYTIKEEKFKEFLPMVFESSTVKIYEYLPVK